MIIWPPELVNEIAARRCVLFVGSGISANAVNAKGEHPKTWTAFLREGNNKVSHPDVQTLIEEKIKAGKLLFACELLKRELKDDYYTLIENEFQRAAYEPVEVHNDICELDTRYIVTPNFDEILDTLAKHRTHSTVVVKNYYDDDVARSLKSAERVILKSHGTIDKVKKLIFTQSDYAEARVKNADFYKILESLLITQTFLFLGCGLDDPDIQLLLENYTYEFSLAQRHYFVIPNNKFSAAEKAVYEETMKIKFLEYDPKDGHKNLLDSIKALVSQVSDQRDVIGSSLKW